MRFDFADCSLDTDSHILRRSGADVAVEPQVFDLICVLASRAGSVVTKDALIEAVWDGRIVSDATISARVSAARTALGDTGRDQRIIRTISRRGFQMVAEVQMVGTNDIRAPEPQDRSTLPDETMPDQTIRYTAAPDGTSIAWSSAGTGPPIVYAWHHFSNLERDWNSPLLRPALRAFAKEHQLIRFDIRGAGLSDPMRDGDTLDASVADLKAVTEAAGLDRFPIVATLQAAATAIRFAARYPERVSHLVLHNAYAQGRALRGAAPYETQGDPFITLLKSGGWGNPLDGFMRAFITMVLPMASAEESSDMIRLIAEAVSTEGALRHRRLIDQIDITQDLAQVRAPTRVIHHRTCAIHPVGEGRRVAAGIPGAEFLEVNSSNTFLIGSDPAFERVIEATLGFLAEG